MPVSARGWVRVAARVDGQAVNSYPRRIRIDQVAQLPAGTPWAGYLAGEDLRYRLLCLDLDAHSGDTGQVLQDCGWLVKLLEELGIDYVVCESGPTEGRHIWIGLADPLDADVVADLARVLKYLAPSLDSAPLLNPHTGCVRPPGAPHRDGGASTVLYGRMEALTRPSTTRIHIRQLHDRVAREVLHCLDAENTTTASTPADASGRVVPVDVDGHRYLPGDKRPLPAYAAAALNTDAARSRDASAVMWTVLIGAAAARWHHRDIAALAATAPGLAHIRSERTATGRRQRSTAAARHLLQRQWDRAITHVLARPTPTDLDATAEYLQRLTQVTVAIRELQARADTCPGRWHRLGGAADRLILDALSRLVLDARRLEVEADIRRLALITGLGRETARTALHRLDADGWITQTSPAAGPKPARWKPQTTISTTLTQPARSQEVPPPQPPPAPPAPRPVYAAHWLLQRELTQRLQASCHDVFTPQGLGTAPGLLYARLPHDQLGVELLDIAAERGLPPLQVQHHLQTLEELHLAHHDPTTGHWRRTLPATRAAAAQALGADGTLAERRRRYQRERQQWAWWLAEHAWMLSPRREQRAPHTQTALDLGPTHNRYPKYPRYNHHGRANHRAAIQAIDAGSLRHLHPQAA